MSDKLNRSLRRFDIQVWPNSLVQYSSTQSHFLPVCHFLCLLSNVVAFYLNKKKYFHVSPSLGHVRTFLFAFRKSCKDFYIMKSDGLYNRCHETMILLQAIYFCTYWTFLCNTTEILQIKGFILSSEEPSSVSPIRLSHVWWLKVLSVYACIYHLIFCQ